METFSLSAVQPQVIGRPVIGNTSGSVPYPIGFDDMIVPEGNIEALREKIESMLNNKNLAEEKGRAMQQRALSSFSVAHLNDMFYDTLLNILDGSYDVNQTDMTKYVPIIH